MQDVIARRGRAREAGAAFVLIDCHGMTDLGRRREVDDARFLIADLAKAPIEEPGPMPADRFRLRGATRAKLLAVADGEGVGVRGAALSAVADCVKDAIPRSSRTGRWREDDLLKGLRVALERCDARVRQAAAADSERTAASLTLVCLLWPNAYVVHAGASRCYLLRPPEFRRVTTDQTFAQRLLDHGVLGEEEAEGSIWEGLLWSALGSGDALTPEVHRVSLRAGDVLLLCSGGLARYVPEPVISATLRVTDSAREACEWLLALAGEGGAADDTTVVTARFG